jgi:hypothetical protein
MVVSIMSAYQSFAAPTAAHEAELDQATRVRIAIYLAMRGCGGFAPGALRDCGRAAGMNGAEMLANEAGTSHDAKGTVCLRFVRALLDEPGAPTAEDLQHMAEVGYRPSEVVAVIEQVGATVRRRNLINSPGEIVNCAELNTRYSDAA